MKSTWLLLSLVFLILFPVSLFSQESFTVSKPRLELSNENLIIEYDIRSSDPADVFKVWIEVADASGNEIKAESLSGDIGDGIFGGTNKRIIWNLESDNTFLDEEIFVKVKAEKKVKPQVIPDTELRRKTITKGNMIISSVVLPGWGQSKVKKGKPYWIIGVTGYGCIAGSVYLNRKAESSYDDYNLSMDFDERNSLYDKAFNQDRYSKILAYTAIGIWAIDIIWILATPNSSLESFSSQYNRKVNIKPYYDANLKATVLSFNYRF